MAALRPMTSEEYEAWLRQAVIAYADDKVASGQWSASESLSLSSKEHEQLLPQGLSTPNNYLYSLVSEAGERVGVLWFAVKSKFGTPIAYVYNIEVEAQHRRRGHACRALLELEREVRRLGLSGVALHVFGHNAAAQALYAKLGYVPTNISLFKPLTAEA